MAPRPSGRLISAVLLSAMLLDGCVGAHAGDDGQEPPAPAYTPRQLAACRSDRVLVSDRREFAGVPPRDMPADLAWAYTRCGAIEQVGYYVDDTAGGSGTHYVWPHDDIVQYLNAMQQHAAADSRRLRRLGKDGWVVEALQRHALGDHVAVFGSVDPKFETLALAFGAKSVTTVEYNQLTFDHPSLTTTTPEELFAAMEDDELPLFDSVLSITSFDHDGLGRYGDPLCPDGDLLAMDQVKRVVKPGGLLFLTVPVGSDVVAWNLHRRYGPIRLPLLLDGWETVDRIGWRPGMEKRAPRITQSYEPVFVLRRPASSFATTQSRRASEL